METLTLKENATTLKLKALADYIIQFPQCSYDDIKRDLKLQQYYIEYLMKRMKKYKMIQFTPEKDKGKYTSSIKVITKQIMLEKVIEPDSICIKCGEEFKPKKKTSKYPNVCLECTRLIFMSPKIVECDYCHEKLERRGATISIKHHKIFHKECMEKFREELKYRYCTCGERLYKNERVCKNCKELDYVECEFCGGKIKAGKQCQNRLCQIKQYIKNDATHFKGVKRNRETPNIIKEILGSECYVCGYSNCIEYHHIIPRSSGGENKLSNYIPLCPNHHQEVHSDLLDISPYVYKVHEHLENILKQK